MKEKKIEAVKKITHPIGIFSSHAHFVSSITIDKEDYIAELPNSGYTVRIDKEIYEEIIYGWENYNAALLQFTGGEIKHNNFVVKSVCTVTYEECF